MKDELGKMKSRKWGPQLRRVISSLSSSKSRKKDNLERGRERVRRRGRRGRKRRQSAIYDLI